MRDEVHLVLGLEHLADHVALVEHLRDFVEDGFSFQVGLFIQNPAQLLYEFLLVA